MISTEPDEDPRAVSAEAVRLLPPGASSVRARVLAAHARILSAYGRFEEAQPAALEALALAEQFDLSLVASDAITTLSGLKRFGPAEALRSALNEAVERAAATGAVQAELRGRFLLGRSYEDRAEWDEAEGWYRSVISKGEAAGLPWAPYAFDARWQLAWLCWVRGRWDEVLQLTDLTRPGAAARVPAAAGPAAAAGGVRPGAAAGGAARDAGGLGARRPDRHLRLRPEHRGGGSRRRPEGRRRRSTTRAWRC